MGRLPKIKTPSLTALYLPLGPGHDHISLPSAAAGTDKPLAPIQNAGVGAVPSSHLCRVRLDLMLARLAPHDKPDLGSGSATERHRRAGFGFHFASGLIGRRLTSWRRTVPSPQCSFDRKLVKRCYAQLNSINALWGLLSPRELLVVHSNRHRPRPVWHLRRSEVEVAGWQ